ncbi:MAG TPA: ribosomal protein S18-alanine N-acetyltransferase [Pyrinomonadaceae bacterium]|nr:ribosomal protein S18-alanine N-acetyltransferase [Pyrinomonadaceae bacterium]
MSSVKVAENTDYSFVLCRMTEHDLLEVVEIEESSGLSRWGWDGYRGELDRPEAIMLVARSARPTRFAGPRVLGFVSARVAGEELHVNNIGIVEEARRLGIGSRLLGAAIERGRALGAKGAALEVRAGNAAAQALYARHGFAVVGRRRNYYRHPQEDALVMAADLTQQA